MIVHAASRHTLHVAPISREDLPANVVASGFTDAYQKFWVVRNFDANGHVFMYLGRGAESAPKQIVAWYAKSGSFWSSYGLTFKAAIDGAQKDGWLYA